MWNSEREKDSKYLKGLGDSHLIPGVRENEEMKRHLKGSGSF